MDRIHIKDYRFSMGILINLEDDTYLSGAKNIDYDRLLMDYKELLDKNKRYFIYCEKGRKSRKAVSILKLYGYNVTQAYNE